MILEMLEDKLEKTKENVWVRLFSIGSSNGTYWMAIVMEDHIHLT